MKHIAIGLAVAACSILLLSRVARAQDTSLAYRWYYGSWNLSDPKQVAIAIGLLPRAAAAGYNGLLLNGVNGHDRSPGYARNVRRLQEEATRYGIEIIPCMLAHNDGSIMEIDPNLAEGLPVKEALFVVRGREATLVPDPAITIPGGDFERAVGDQVTGWSLQDSPGVSSFPDRAVSHTGEASARVQDLPKAEYGRVRFSQRVKATPFRQYRLRVWARTEGYTGNASLLVIAPTEKQRNLAETYLPVRPTQDWTCYDLIVNSLNFDALNVYLMCGGGGAGRLWWDDATIEEIGIHNILRRDGTPLTVRGEDGVVYVEGRDFDAVRDPALAVHPTVHAPLPIRLTARSRIPDGARLRVSYYQPLYLDGYVVSCLSEPRVYEILREELDGINRLLHPKTFFMYDDEVRIGNWDESCQKRGLTPGQLLADKVRRCIAMVREVRPAAEIWDWSDMFCPLENATGDYYAVNGTWAGSWEGLTPNIGIVNWGNHLEGRNLKWFADRGHRQILAGYYDGDGYPIDKWLKAGEGLPGIVGAMYTTWRDDYSHLEAFAEQAWGKPVVVRVNAVAGECDHTPVAGARMTFGSGFWRSGSTRLMPWIYRWELGDPLNYLDSGSMDVMVRNEADGTPVPVAPREAYREGYDDLRYTHTLEQAIAAGRHSSSAEVRREAEDAQQMLDEVRRAVPVQSEYRYRGFWSPEEMDVRRWLIAERPERLTGLLRH